MFWCKWKVIFQPIALLAEDIIHKSKQFGAISVWINWQPDTCNCLGKLSGLNASFWRKLIRPHKVFQEWKGSKKNYKNVKMTNFLCKKFFLSFFFCKLGKTNACGDLKQNIYFMRPHTNNKKKEVRDIMGQWEFFPCFFFQFTF